MADNASALGAAGSVHDRSLAYWSGRAPEYSRLHEDELASERGTSFAAVLAGLPPVRPGARVLDLGCGSGLLSIVLAGRGCRVTGVDFSADMLAQARNPIALEKSNQHPPRDMRHPVGEAIVRTLLNDSDFAAVHRKRQRRLAAA